MRTKIEDYLHKIDLSFDGKTQQEIYMTYFLVVAIIFAFAYFFFWDSSLKSFENTRNSVISLNRKITNERQYLQRHPTAKIAQIERDIQKINKNIIRFKDANSYIKSKIETIASLIYDERSWGEYLDSISTNAQKYNVKLLSLTDEYANSESSFGHILDIYVESKGNFKNTLNFINSLEQSDLVVDIHGFNMSAKTSLTSDLNISVWGIIY
ncbi:FIG00638667: hypothetical protein [hydrothermal vent metagenome]|uniref:Uncharacterized protein n=1 Tax=hydrothermal vent metagenome TaxID=652676 RepID=A0A1W1BFA0_9ZZZZ